nr:hypothetical protein [uncultured Sphingomonas sp.]
MASDAIRNPSTDRHGVSKVRDNPAEHRLEMVMSSAAAWRQLRSLPITLEKVF